MAPVPLYIKTLMVLTLVVETVVLAVEAVVLLDETVVLLAETVCEILLVESVLMLELLEFKLTVAAEALKTLKLTVNPNINSKLNKYFLINNSLHLMQ
jgi:hypothetical protein